MKKLYVKANRHYRKAFQTITTICELNGKKYAVKEAAEPEAKAHIENMYEHRNFKYPNLTLCPCEMKDDQLWFEYISGETLTDRFKDAVQREDKEYFYKLLDDYLELLKFYDEDYCIFDNSPAFQAVFGDGSAFVGKKAVRNCAFDCTTNNIIIRDEKAYFIDYEWCFDFAIPYDLFVYHCIYTLYDGNGFIFEKIEPFENVLKKLNFSGEKLEGNRTHFMHFILNENANNTGLFIAKQRYLKSTVCLSQYAHVRAEEKENYLQQQKYIEYLQDGIKAHQENDKNNLKYIQQLENYVKELEDGIKWHQNNDKNSSMYIAQLEERRQELENGIEWHHQNDKNVSLYMKQIKEQNDNLLLQKDNEIKFLIQNMKNQDIKVQELTEELFKIKNSFVWKLFKIFNK